MNWVNYSDETVVNDDGTQMCRNIGFQSNAPCIAVSGRIPFGGYAVSTSLVAGFMLQCSGRIYLPKSLYFPGCITRWESVGMRFTRIGTWGHESYAILTDGFRFIMYVLDVSAFLGNFDSHIKERGWMGYRYREQSITMVKLHWPSSNQHWTSFNTRRTFDICCHLRKRLLGTITSLMITPPTHSPKNYGIVSTWRSRCDWLAS